MQIVITAFSRNILQIIKAIPEGKVLTYGIIAALAGNPRAARQVSRVLHSMSAKHNLPWHRVINSKGQISLKPSNGYELQKRLLETEGVVFFSNDTIDLEKFLWDIDSMEF